MDEVEEDVIRLRLVHSEKLYDVWVIKFKEMATTTYGVINRDTEVVEGVQPILSNAKALAKQFSVWLDAGLPDDSVLRILPGGGVS